MSLIKLRCSATLITALLMAISVFVANVSHTEYKSQMNKRKLRKQEKEIASKMLDSEVPEEVENV